LGEATVNQQRRAGTAATRDQVRASACAIGDPAALAGETVTFEQVEARVFEPAQGGIEVDEALISLNRKRPSNIVWTPSVLLHVAWDGHGCLLREGSHPVGSYRRNSRESSHRKNNPSLSRSRRG
jgi:hypothetical protein